MPTIQQEFFTDIPALSCLNDVPAPSRTFLNRIVESIDRPPKRTHQWLHNVVSFLDDVFALILVPKPALSLPVILLLGVAATMVFDSTTSSPTSAYFDTLLTGGRRPI